MAHFHELDHGNCVLQYVGGALELRKLDFRGLKGQLDVKNANSMGLIAKIRYLRPISTFKICLWPISLDYAVVIVS